MLYFPFSHRLSAGHCHLPVDEEKRSQKWRMLAIGIKCKNWFPLATTPHVQSWSTFFVYCLSLWQSFCSLDFHFYSLLGLQGLGLWGITEILSHPLRILRKWERRLCSKFNLVAGRFSQHLLDIILNLLINQLIPQQSFGCFFMNIIRLDIQNLNWNQNIDQLHN